MSQAYLPIFAGPIGLAYGIYCLIKLILVRNWPVVEGEIVTSNRSHRPSDIGKMEDAEVVYEYAVSGKVYRARVIQAGGDMSSSPSKSANDVDRILAKYPVGNTVAVFYNPRFPQMACLERSDATAAFIGILFGPLAIAVGYFFL